jgi:hypothetical protein
MPTDEADKHDIADALARMADGVDKPQRPVQPPGASEPPLASAAPIPTASAKQKPARPDRPDRPVGPPSIASDDDSADVGSEYDPNEIIDDGDAVIVPAPEPEVFAPHAPAKKPAKSVGVPNSLAFRRTIIPILLTCGVLLFGIGLLKWIGGADSLFSDMATALSATLCGAGAFLLLVAVLNMLQVKAEMAQVKRSSS